MHKEYQKGTVIFYLLVLISFCFYLWMAEQIPYAHDDWDWGLSIGIQQLLTANLNSRYAGNLIEIVLTRSEFMKTVVMGTILALIPFFAVQLISQIHELAQESKCSLLLFMNIMMLTIPTKIWCQTIGWVAGFSNFVVSILCLIVYQLFLIRNSRESVNSIMKAVLLLFFGCIIQLFLENITVYVMILTTAWMIWLYRKNKHFTWQQTALFLGNLIGFAVMFSSSMYTTLMSTGSAVDGYRTLSFDRNAGLITILFGFFRRFAVQFPNQIWAQQTVLCEVTLLLLCFILLKTEKAKRKAAWIVINVGFAAYFLYYHFYGQIQLPSEWWSNVLSAGISILYFCAVICQVFSLFGRRNVLTAELVFTWVSAPLIILPMLVISSVGPRSFLTSDLFLIEFCMLLVYALLKHFGTRERCAMAAGCLAVLCMLWWNYGCIYRGIGAIKNEREALIESARNGETHQILMRNFPHREYLWQTEPAYGSERVAFFREFYRIPEDTKLWFEYWDADPAALEQGASNS